MSERYHFIDKDTWLPVEKAKMSSMVASAVEFYIENRTTVCVCKKALGINCTRPFNSFLRLERKFSRPWHCWRAFKTTTPLTLVALLCLATGWLYSRFSDRKMIDWAIVQAQTESGGSNRVVLSRRGLPNWKNGCLERIAIQLFVWILLAMIFKIWIIWTKFEVITVKGCLPFT